MRVLITGGGGFLGSLVTEQVARRGHDAVVLDRFCFLDPDTFSGLLSRSRGSVLPVRGDVRRLQAVPEATREVDRVIHLVMPGPEDLEALGEETLRDLCVETTRELAAAASRAGARRFVLVTDSPESANPVVDALHREAETAVLSFADTGMMPVIIRSGPLFGVSHRMRFDLPMHRLARQSLEENTPVKTLLRAILEAGGMPVGHVAAHVTDAALDETEEAGTGVSSANGAGDSDTKTLYPPKPSETDMRAALEALVEGLRTGRWNPDAAAHHNRRVWERLRAVAARDGGEPVAPRFIPLARPCVGAEEEQAVVEAIRSGWMTSGPHVPAFERLFSETVGARGAVALVSCTAAIHACLVHAGVKAGDMVATSPITWASTGNTLWQMGVKPWFVDIEPDTLNLNPDLLEEALRAGVRAVIPVHMAGHPCRMEEIRALADRHGVPVIEDAAHALGASYHGDPIGTRGSYVCFSFYAIKNITTMEGGMITTDRPETAAELKHIAANGMSATAWDRYGRSAVPGPAVVTGPGFKYAMGNVSAAMGICQLRKLERFQRRRREVAARYLEKLADVEEIVLPREKPYARSAWHLFIIRLRLDRLTVDRDQFCDDLRHENIGTGIHFYGMHLHPWFREQFGDWTDRLPEATAASREVISLPLWPGITDEQVDAVAAAIRKVVTARHKKRG
ncbi:MAG TPA: aminotransferase class I/II-fold pyridoxal phosphate-dependent enzyme [Candidatus Hydrogenedentes bacterium]|nr:aminotransferase class I/II-fold pyridoxal phosphate-dependent enzyme [Candidatus Hydrogenedentota bacterium]